MKRGILIAFGLVALALSVQPRAAAAPVILSKDASGHILPNAVSLELRSNPDCDQTKAFIPDLSTLVSETFAIAVDDKGIGFFSGPVRVLSPDGRVILVGMLHGTVGLTAQSTDATKGCHLPGHLEGVLQGGVMPQASTAAGATDTSYATRMPFEVNFAADVNEQAAGIVPVYRGHLVGLIPPPQPPPPPLPRVVIVPSKPLFVVTEPIVALISNRADRDIQAMDMQSYCSIVRLERKTVDGWTQVGGCALARMPQPVLIKAGTTMKVSLPEVAIPEFKHEPGTYHMVLEYQFVDAAGKVVGDSLKAVSPEFQVAVPPNPVARLKVAPDKPGYNLSDTITAIIYNGDVPVRILDEESLCTIVQLQRAEGTGWVLVGPCPLDRIPLPTYLKAGEVKSVALTPSAPWLAGRYRLAVTYTTVNADGTLTAEQTAFSDPFPVMGPPPVPAVTLTPDKRSYLVTDPIGAVFVNASTMDVTTWDHRSFCTTVNLQIKRTTGWDTIAPCMLMTPTMPVVLKAGTTVLVNLPPVASVTPKWEAGTYRLQAVCGTPDSAGTPAGAAFEVVSGPFAVGAVTTTFSLETPELTPITLR